MANIPVVLSGPGLSARLVRETVGRCIAVQTTRGRTQQLGKELMQARLRWDSDLLGLRA